MQIECLGSNIAATIVAIHAGLHVMRCSQLSDVYMHYHSTGSMKCTTIHCCSVADKCNAE